MSIINFIYETTVQQAIYLLMNMTLFDLLILAEPIVKELSLLRDACTESFILTNALMLRKSSIPATAARENTFLHRQISMRIKARIAYWKGKCEKMSMIQ